MFKFKKLHSEPQRTLSTSLSLVVGQRSKSFTGSWAGDRKAHHGQVGLSQRPGRKNLPRTLGGRVKVPPRTPTSTSWAWEAISRSQLFPRGARALLGGELVWRRGEKGSKDKCRGARGQRGTEMAEMSIRQANSCNMALENSLE